VLAGTGLDPSVSGMTGAQGPALGIRKANSVAVAPPGGAGMESTGASISFATSARAESSYVVNQEWPEPVTPLKTLGRIVDTFA
jgi:hypothetical protein